MVARGVLSLALSWLRSGFPDLTPVAIFVILVKPMLRRVISGIIRTLEVDIERFGLAASKPLIRMAFELLSGPVQPVLLFTQRGTSIQA